MRLSHRSEPFDSDQFIYELKVDGFRALAHMSSGNGELISRNGNVFRGFAPLAAWLAEHLRIENAVLDGEICCLDDSGWPNFRDLLFRQREAVFMAYRVIAARELQYQDSPWRFILMQGTIGVLTFTDGSHGVTFYPTTMAAGTVPSYKVKDLDALKQFFRSINVTLTPEQIQQLTPTKGLSIHNLNPPDDILRRYGLI